VAAIDLGLVIPACDFGRERATQQENKKGHGTSLRRHAMASILQRDNPKVVPPSRFHRTSKIGNWVGATGADSGNKPSFLLSARYSCLLVSAGGDTQVVLCSLIAGSSSLEFF